MTFKNLFNLVCTTPSTPPGGMAVTCTDSDTNGENVPSSNDVCTLTCTSGQTPTVATTTCQANGMFDATLECPAGRYLYTYIPYVYYSVKELKT